MALLTKTSVYINKKNIPFFEQLTLSQGINDHNVLTLRCRVADLPLENKSTDMLGVMKEYLGGRVSIAIAAEKDEEINANFYAKELQFKGVIMDIVEDAQEKGRGKLVTFTINSPTMLMDHSHRHNSYSERGLDEIIQETVKGYDTDKLTTDIRPTFQTPLLYTVQDQRSDFEFLKRLASYYGQWLYYDGMKLIFGKPDTAVIEMEYGKNLKTVQIHFHPTDTNIQFVTSDYLTNDVHEKDSSEVATSKEHLQKDIDARAKRLLHKKNTQYIESWYTDKHLANRFERQLEQYTKARAVNQVTLKCKSDDPGVKIGSIVKIKDHGRYRVIQVTHTNTHHGDYENTFTAIEASTEVYPMMDIHAMAISKNQIAMVKDNNDPEKLGRIKVQFSWQRKTGKTTPWIRVASIYAGADHGVYYIPEIGDEVMVAFEGENAERPYVMHSLYNGINKPKAQWFDPKNLTKGMYTPTGIQMVMSDKDKSMILSDPSGNAIVLQGNGEILVKAPKAITFVTTDLTFMAGNSINMIAKPGQDENGQKNGEGIINVMAEKLIDVKAENETISLTSKQDFNVFSTDGATNLAAKTEMNINGEGSVNVDGDSIAVTGGSKIKVESSDTDVF